MTHKIKQIKSEQEIDNAIDFSRKIFGENFAGLGSREAQKEMLLKIMSHDSDLLLYAESNNIMVGIAFGGIEEDGNMVVKVLAVDESFRGSGIAHEMMLMLEERAKTHNVSVIALGAVETGEEFYAKLGYTGSLLIQSEKHSIDELLAINTKYPVNYTRVHDETIQQVNLAISAPDRDLQQKYETNLPGCYTQMMFWKNI